MIVRTIQAPDGGIKVTEPGKVFDNTEYVGVQTGDQGRGLVLLNAPHTTVHGDCFTPGTDDALCLHGDCRGTLVSNCLFPLRYFGTNNPSKALIGYTAQASNEIGPTYGAADGYAGSFYRPVFKGGAIRLSSGVWQFIEPEITINALYGIDLTAGRINLINPRFLTMPQPPEASYWYQNGDPCGIRVAGNSKLYIVGATLDGQPISGRDLCRRYPTDADRKAGRTQYGLPGSVPATAFTKGPIS